MRPYRPLRDPLFWSALAVHLAARLLRSDLHEGTFVTAHLADLLLVPVCVPPLIAALDLIGARPRGSPPDAAEVLVPLVCVAVAFEILLPRAPYFAEFTYGDPRDITAYAAGALLAAIWWRLRHGGGALHD